jgi:glycosyltransferase involved in cell wall biosynthesis
MSANRAHDSAGLRILIEVNSSDLRIGAVNDALDLAELAGDAGARFLLCGDLGDELRREAEGRGMTIVHGRSREFSRRGLPRYAADVMAWMIRLSQWRPDVVHLNYAGYGSSLARAAWQCNIPVVARAGPYLPDNPSNRWIAAYLANCRAHADSLLASPLRDRVTVTGDLYRPDRVQRTLTPERPIPPLRPGVARIVFLGQLVERKGLHILVEALARTTGACELLLAGGDWMSEGYPQRIQAMAAAAGLLDRIHFENHRQDVGALLTTADIFVLPSLSEARPRSIIEAMSLGVAVIGSDAGGIPSLITHDQNGVIVAAGDASSLAQAIDRLVASPELRRRLGAAARAYVERDCRADRTALEYLTVYRRITAQRRGAPGRRSALETTGSEQ